VTSQLVKWYEKNKGKNIEVVMVSYDRTEAAMKKYMKGKKVQFPAMAFKHKGLESVQSYSGKFLPCMTLVDESGKAVLKDTSLAEVEKKLK